MARTAPGGPPGTGKTHLSIALGVQACRRAQRVAFATAHDWDNRLGAAKRAGRLDDELQRLGRVPLLIVDEVGYIPFDTEAAALFFALISSRYERSSLILSSNKTFSAWAEIFGNRLRSQRWLTAWFTMPKSSSRSQEGRRDRVRRRTQPVPLEIDTPVC